MKNDSVKFKKSTARSSTNSVISDFSMECSPVPNINLFANFTHANSVSARLSKNSMLTDENIRLSHPKCNPTQRYIENDEVLSKSPLTRGLLRQPIVEMSSFSAAMGQFSKFTKETLKKIKKIEKFMDDNNQQTQQYNILEDHTTPKSDNRYNHLQVNMDLEVEEEIKLDELDESQKTIARKLQNLLSDLRIIRKNPVYFESYDGQYALHNNLQAMYQQLQNGKNGLIMNIGKYLQSIVLEQDTFRSTKICENPEKCDYSAISAPDQHFSDWIIAASESGTILSWSSTQQKTFSSYAIKDDLFKTHTKPTFIAQNLMNFYVGTSDDKTYVLDSRMKEKHCLSFESSHLNIQKSSSFQRSPLIPKMDEQFNMDSPKNSKTTMDYFKETNFNQTIIEEEPESALTPMKIMQSQSGVRYIDSMDTNLLVTMQHGFALYDIRQPQQVIFSVYQGSYDPIKTVFSPNDSENVIFADRNSHTLRVWNVSQNRLIFEKDMQSPPLDLLVSKETREVVTLQTKDHSSIISIYNNEHSKLRFSDKVQLDNFHINKILLDSTCETLYGLGPFSLRTWNFYNRREMDLLSNKLTKYVIGNQKTQNQQE